MTVCSRRIARRALLAFAALAFAAWLLPSYLGASRYRRRLEAGLEHILHRPATFGSASFRLLPRPGFSIDNAVIHEDPAFGSEPFARIDRIDCDLRWRSLWHGRVEFARLRLDRPTLNIVRNDQGEWNIENLLAQSGLAGRPPQRLSSSDGPPSFDIETEDARLNFKVGANKKPFTIVDLRARVNLDPVAGRIQFRFQGSPVRSDSPLPTPGALEFSGEWKPAADSGGALDANLRTREALLYNWVPLVTGYNPEIYGVLDADARLRGSFKVIRIEGEASVAQLHRWDLLPPSDSTPLNIRFRGEFDRGKRRALIESCEASFAGSHAHLTGAVEKIPESPELDLVVAIERTRVEDVQVLSRRFWRFSPDWGLLGRMDGLLSFQGYWHEPRVGGFITTRDVRVKTAAGTFPASDLAVRVDKDGARLAPITVSLVPRLDVVVEGAVYPSRAKRRGSREVVPPRYEVKVGAKSAELRELVRLARGLGIAAASRLDAQGVSSGSVILSGVAWPPARPSLEGKAEIRAARLLVPGLTEPVNIPRARMQFRDDHVIIDAVTAVMGTSTFTGRLEHQGARQNPWWFDIRANGLIVEQGALWFDVFGLRPPRPLLDRIPGLSSLAAQRSVASGLFSVLNARGHFETPNLTYRSLSMQDFQTTVEVSGRIVRLTDASFRAGGGRVRGQAQLDLTQSPPRIAGEVAVAAVKVQSLSNRLPVAMRKAHGLISGTARFETRGLTRGEMSAGLQAEGKAHLEKLTLGEFDPLAALVRATGAGQLEPERGEATLRAGDFNFKIRDRKISALGQRVDLQGAKLNLTGTWTFGGMLDLDVTADLRHVVRRWAIVAPETSASSRIARVRIGGPIDQITTRGEATAAQAQR